MESNQNLIVGAGISGLVIAHKIATFLNEPVLVIDSKNHIGGQCFDYKDEETGIYVHKYGPHIFHTSDKIVWDFISQFTDWYPYSHEVRAKIDGKEIPVPFNLNSLYMVFPTQKAQRIEKKLIQRFGMNQKVSIVKLKSEQDEDLSECAQYVYEKVFLNYTIKQWGISPEKIGPEVMERVPVYIGFDNRYFPGDLYQGIPIQGYTNAFLKMLNNPFITIKLNTSFTDLKNIQQFKRIFYTGSIDEFFNYDLGQLPYRTVMFDFKKINTPYFQRATVINYPNDNKYTRISEYKYFLNTISDKTIISYEYPEAFDVSKSDRYYPIINEENISLYQKYFNRTKNLNNLYFLGRLGKYKYYDMDDAIKAALDLFKEIINE